MRRLGITLLFVAASGCKPSPSSGEAPAPSASVAPPPESGTIRITPRVPPVGTKTVQRRSSEMKLVLLLDGPRPGTANKLVIERSDTEARREEVLAAGMNAVTRVRATFQEMSAKETRNDSPQPTKPSPVVGKTYEVSREEGGSVKIDAGGKPPSDPERDVVSLSYARLGQPDPLQSALPAGRIRVGDHVIALEASLGTILASDARTKVHDVSAILAGVENDGREAVFELTAIADGDAGPVLTKTSFHGKLRVRIADGAPLELSLEGPVVAVTNTAARPPGHPHGEGQSRLSVTATYE